MLVTSGALPVIPLTKANTQTSLSVNYVYIPFYNYYNPNLHYLFVYTWYCLFVITNRFALDIHNIQFIETTDVILTT